MNSQEIWRIQPKKLGMKFCGAGKVLREWASGGKARRKRLIVSNETRPINYWIWQGAHERAVSVMCWGGTPEPEGFWVNEKRYGDRE